MTPMVKVTAGEIDSRSCQRRTSSLFCSPSLQKVVSPRQETTTTNFNQGSSKRKGLIIKKKIKRKLGKNFGSSSGLVNFLNSSTTRYQYNHIHMALALPRWHLGGVKMVRRFQRVPQGSKGVKRFPKRVIFRLWFVAVGTVGF